MTFSLKNQNKLRITNGNIFYIYTTGTINSFFIKKVTLFPLYLYAKVQVKVLPENVVSYCNLSTYHSAIGPAASSTHTIPVIPLLSSSTLLLLMFIRDLSCEVRWILFSLFRLCHDNHIGSAESESKICNGTTTCSTMIDATIMNS